MVILEGAYEMECCSRRLQALDPLKERVSQESLIGNSLMLIAPPFWYNISHTLCLQRKIFWKLRTAQEYGL